MPRCWTEVLFLFMQHEYKIRESGRNFPRKGMVPLACRGKQQSKNSLQIRGKRRIKEIGITISKHFLKKRDDCSPLKPRVTEQNMPQQSKASFLLVFAILLTLTSKILFFAFVLSSRHTYNPCRPSPPNRGQLRKVILSPGVNLCRSPLCCAAVPGWDLFRCRDDRRKNNEAAEYVWRVAESSYHHVFV